MHMLNQVVELPKNHILKKKQYTNKKKPGYDSVPLFCAWFDHHKDTTRWQQEKPSAVFLARKQGRVEPCWL